VGLLLLPLLGPVLTGGGYEVPVVGVVGWTLYAVAGATLLPYASLASVHGRQRRVLALRLLEVGSLAAVAALVVLAPGAAEWSPVALALGPVIAAVAVRQSVVLRLAGPAPRRPAEEVVTA
jgi:hypothetical protein